LPEACVRTGARPIEATLVANPNTGAILVGTGGVRKLRIQLEGGGKRGGARLIYYHREAKEIRRRCQGGGRNVGDRALAVTCREAGVTLVAENARDVGRIARVFQFEFIGSWPMPTS